MASATPQPAKMTPMLKQYFGVKRQYPDAILFFRMGDFFELFFEDAKIAAEVLGIALTSRSKEADMPMAGVPVRAVDGYLQKLILAGHTVVICDQVQDPKEAKGIVERAVTRIVTPGTVLEETLLEGGRHNFLAALSIADRGRAGMAWVDLSTGRFEGTELTAESLGDELAHRGPAELLLAEHWRDSEADWAQSLNALDEAGPALTYRPDHEFETSVAADLLKRQFQVSSLEGFGLEADEPLVAAAGAVLAYVRETQQGNVDHLRPLKRCTTSGVMILDRNARHALEIVETNREGRREGSLLWCIDRTKTAAGARLLRDWVLEPLTDAEEIRTRHDTVQEFVEDRSTRDAMRTELQGIFDLERVTARLMVNRTSPRDLAQIRDSLGRLPALVECLGSARTQLVATARQQLVSPPGLPELLEKALVQAPPITAKEGGVIREGFSPELDELRTLRNDSQDLLLKMQREEIERTGISTLKIGFHSVFGYYLEVSHANKDKVPENYIRKQTLKNAERYITPELKEFEAKALVAEERSLKLEMELFEKLRTDAAEHGPALQTLGRALATLDALGSLAEAAQEHGYRRPTIDDSQDLDVEEGYHPVLAVTLGKDAFVANDCRLGGDHPRFALITGPNMAGKSTYLRQTALLVLMAQMGSFVPAKRARLGVADRIFTRVGASDDLVRGASTFMVEMTETASILHHATDRSLVILDEIGRGTGTFDGLSLSRALAEHLAEHVRCRSLFATHYHQLTQLADEFSSVRNLSVGVREWGEEIIFLYRILEGGTDRSYGIHVARLAGIPDQVIERAQSLLRELETLSPELRQRTSREGTAKTRVQESLFSPPAENLLRALRRIDIDGLTPLQALNQLAKLKAQADGTAPKSRRKKVKQDPGPGLFGNEASAG